MQGRKQMQRVHAEAFARHLDVPEEWFVTEDFGRWINRRAGEGQGEPFQASTLAGVVDRLETELQALRRELEQQGGRRSPK